MTDQLYKADAGKLLPALLLDGAPRALLLVIAVLTYGAQKYETHSWRRVAAARYRDAKYRHMFAEILGEKADNESGLLHEAHEITNLIFLIEQKLEGLSAKQFKKLLEFNAPPQEHKAEEDKTKVELDAEWEAAEKSGDDDLHDLWISKQSWNIRQEKRLEEGRGK